jgi:hypothetical protein
MKAWDLPIAKNPLYDKSDLAASLDELMKPLLGRFVRENSGLHLGNSSALYDDRIALLEGLSRLLWGLAPYAGGSKEKTRGAEPSSASERAIGLVLEGLAVGTDPGHRYYWGAGGDRDQRYVEMAAIGYSLLIARETFWDPLSAGEKENLSAWLGLINSVELPPTNWEFFRVIVNVALRSLDRPFDPVRLAKSLDAIDALYRADGWYVDETNYDLYNPIAFHFYGLVYARECCGFDPLRAGRFRERAALFARQYIAWFDKDGSAVPFGRSLCYRFAASSFFSACAFAEEEVLPWGILKGLVLRNLRWWLKEPIFDHEGVLSIGYRYPNLIAAEQYNSPGSPYWSLKAYLPLAFDAAHPFWAAKEEPLPEIPAVSLNAPPGILACRSRHVYFLNAGQYPGWESANAAAKYAKFAYSSRFGFCVSRSSYDLPKLGCDSSLLFSEGDGYWRERRQSRDRFACLDYAYSAWNPWPDLTVRTWLLPCGHWHLRLHRIDSGRGFDCVEGGFSLPQSQGFEGPCQPEASTPRAGSLYAEYPWAAGGIVDLSPAVASGARKAELHSPEPDLNLMHPRVLVPILSGRIEAGETVLACAVFAIPLENDDDRAEANAAWERRPSFSFDDRTGKAEIEWAGKKIVIETVKPSKS